MTQTDRARLTTSFLPALALGLAVCLAVAILASRWIVADTRDAIYQAFNEEQLITARNARDAIERGLEGIEREMLTAVRELERAGTSRSVEDIDRVLAGSLERLQPLGVRWLAAGAASGDPARILRRYSPEAQPLDADDPLVRPVGLDTLAAGEILRAESRVDETGVTLSLATRRLAAAPAASGAPACVLVADLELTRFLAPYLRDLRSGRTGYAWLIDGEGRFLYHPVAAFVGGDAFAVRERAYPDASYDLINEIQSAGMLRGREGTTRYTSGHHRGRAGCVEKLIAYTCVPMRWRGGADWSLAVVAPVDDLEAALRRSSLWQLMLGGGTVVMVLLGGGAILLLELRWRRRLERRVVERTEDLKRSEERYRSLVESCEDAIFTLDAEHRVRAANSCSARFFGLRPSEIEGRPLADLLPDDVAGEQDACVRRVVAGGRSVRSTFVLDVDGRGRRVDASYMPLRVHGGRAAGALCIARDVTEQHELEHHLLQTEKLASLGTLAAGFAHEINNPLAVMLGFSRLALKQAESGSRLHEDLKVIERQGEHCRRIMENLLSIARTEPETSDHADLNRAVAETLHVVGHSLEMAGIETREALAPNLPPVRGDFRQLQQVLLNLINNALAAMPDGGRLDIVTERVAADVVEARIADTGCGIAPEDLPHVFEPFFTTKGPGEGTGLGLFVSYGIVTKYGGELLCRSRRTDGVAEPAGTTLIIRLPVQQEART